MDLTISILIKEMTMNKENLIENVLALFLVVFLLVFFVSVGFGVAKTHEDQAFCKASNGIFIPTRGQKGVCIDKSYVITDGK